MQPSAADAHGKRSNVNQPYKNGSIFSRKLKKGRAAKDRSCSSDDFSDNDKIPNAEKSKKVSKKNSKGKTSSASASASSRAVPKKSATAKPISKSTKKPFSDNESDSDFGDFSLPRLTAKAKQVTFLSPFNRPQG